MSDLSFHAMGCEIRLIVEGPAPGMPDPAEAVESGRRFIEDFDERLSRFHPASELCALNADARHEVPASPLMREAVRSGVWAARASGGLVDPTLVGELETVGYRESRDGVEPARVRDALLFAPARRPARPAAPRWRAIEVDDARGLILRPPGLRLDTGGTGKGLAADLLTTRLRGYGRVVVDCGGDLCVAGTNVGRDPVDVHVQHPLTKQHDHVVRVAGGAVATSGIDVRLWRRGDGTYAHHLLDPSTGRPAWTGVVGATALARTALEAETLAKTALLSGPDGAREVLRERGGLLVHDDGGAEIVGRAPIRPRYELTIRAAAAQGLAA